MRLQNRVAIITGGGTGIGKAIATVFAAEGAAVAVAGRRPTPLAESVKQIASNGGKAIAIPTDIANEKQVQDMVARTLKEYGQIDILVNDSAYAAPHSDVVDTSQENWNNSLAVNLTGTMMCTREVLKNMIPRQTGSIISLSSIAGVTGIPGGSAYSATKSGIIGFTQTLAMEVGHDNIRANSITPAFVATEKNLNGLRNLAKQKGMSYEEFMDKMLRHYALKRVAKPSEVATVALFLASDDASAITGQNLIVSCGFQMMHPGMIS